MCAYCFFFFFFSFEARVRNEFANDTEKIKVGLEAKRLLEQYILAYEGAFYLTNVTSKSDFVFDENDTNYAWQGIGYKTILDILIHKYPDPTKALPFHEKLKLSEEVTKIHWSPDGVVVETKNDASYRAKRVVFTPSLNVLKQEHEEIFEPQLPTSKLEALEDLGMDAIMKVQARFGERWWPEEANFAGYSFLWDDHSLQEVQVLGSRKSGRTVFVFLSCRLPIIRGSSTFAP